MSDNESNPNNRTRIFVLEMVCALLLVLTVIAFGYRLIGTEDPTLGRAKKLASKSTRDADMYKAVVITDERWINPELARHVQVSDEWTSALGGSGIILEWDPPRLTIKGNSAAFYSSTNNILIGRYITIKNDTFILRGSLASIQPLTQDNPARERRDQ